MSLRNALLRSVETTPDVLAKTIATQRQQLADQMQIADRARVLLGGEPDQEDWDRWETASRRANEIQRALRENLEMQMQSRATVHEASTPSLVEELKRRALKENDKQALAALKIPVAKKAGGARVSG